MDMDSIRQLNERVEQESQFLQHLLNEIKKMVVGQETLIERVLIALLADGHILLEGVPGLAKTLLVKTVAQSLEAGFARIQFTPDLLPADLLGTQIYNPRTNEFSTHYGPIFTNIVLADEINRAPSKVQSALLEAMQERQITIGGQTFHLDDLFLVMATQNPIEQEGTYPLPEAQVDRFMLKVMVDYPSADEEKIIVQRMTGAPLEPVKAVLSPSHILNARQTVREIHIDERLVEYVIRLVQTTRKPVSSGLSDLHQLIAFGASPRASIFMVVAARAHAFLKGRGFVTPEDIKQVAPDVLRHRVIISYEAEAENISSADIVQQVLDHVEVP